MTTDRRGEGDRLRVMHIEHAELARLKRGFSTILRQSDNSNLLLTAVF